MSSLRNTLDSYIVPVQRQLGSIPLDGLVISALTFFLSPPNDRIRNTLIVGGAHYLIHESVVHAENAPVELSGPSIVSPNVPVGSLPLPARPAFPHGTFTTMPVSPAYM